MKAKTAEHNKSTPLTKTSHPWPWFRCKTYRQLWNLILNTDSCHSCTAGIRTIAQRQSQNATKWQTKVNKIKATHCTNTVRPLYCTDLMHFKFQTR